MTCLFVFYFYLKFSASYDLNSFTHVSHLFDVLTYLLFWCVEGTASVSARRIRVFENVWCYSPVPRHLWFVKVSPFCERNRKWGTSSKFRGLKGPLRSTADREINNVARRGDAEASYSNRKPNTPIITTLLFYGIIFASHISKFKYYFFMVNVVVVNAFWAFFFISM